MYIPFNAPYTMTNASLDSKDVNVREIGNETACSNKKMTDSILLFAKDLDPSHPIPIRPSATVSPENKRLSDRV